MTGEGAPMDTSASVYGFSEMKGGVAASGKAPSNKKHNENGLLLPSEALANSSPFIVVRNFTDCQDSTNKPAIDSNIEESKNTEGKHEDQAKQASSGSSGSNWRSLQDLISIPAGSLHFDEQMGPLFNNNASMSNHV